jgi:hypothetical protein
MAVVFLGAQRVASTRQYICFYFYARDGHAPLFLLYWVLAGAWWHSFGRRVLKEMMVFPEVDLWGVSCLVTCLCCS